MTHRPFKPPYIGNRFYRLYPNTLSLIKMDIIAVIEHSSECTPYWIDFHFDTFVVRHRIQMPVIRIPPTGFSLTTT